MRTAAVCLVALACALTPATCLAGSLADAHRHAARLHLVKTISQLKLETWRLQALMEVPRTDAWRPTRTTAGLRRALAAWRAEERRAVHLARRPPHRREWLCIHRYEGPWNAHTGNGYYGGLQMDIGFQRRYGGRLLARKGTADGWAPLEQMWIAERARRSGRGFTPWPNTARYCGLL